MHGGLKTAMNRAHKVTIPRSAAVEQQVPFWKAFANPTRWRILDQLADHVCRPGNIQKELGIAAANLSQYKTGMKSAGIAARIREGKRVLFSLAMPEVKAVHQLIQRMIRQQIRASRRLMAFACRS